MATAANNGKAEERVTCSSDGLGRKKATAYQWPMRHLIIAAALASTLSFGANASTLNQWRQRPPRWQTNSTRSLAELQGCLGSRWASTLSAKIDAMPIDRGMSYTNAGINRDILVDLTDEGDHRVIKLWLRTFMGITAGANEQIQKLSACAAAE